MFYWHQHQHQHQLHLHLHRTTKHEAMIREGMDARPTQSMLLYSVTPPEAVEALQGRHVFLFPSATTVTSTAFGSTLILFYRDATAALRTYCFRRHDMPLQRQTSFSIWMNRPLRTPQPSISQVRLTDSPPLRNSHAALTAATRRATPIAALY